MPTIVRTFAWKLKSKYFSSPNLPPLDKVLAVERLTLSRMMHFDPDRDMLPRNAQLCAVHHEGRVLEFTYGTIARRNKEAYDTSNAPTTDSNVRS